MRFTLLSILSLAVVSTTTAQGANSSELLVPTTNGPVLGHYAATAPASVREFLGIPYGAPPIGRLRFAPAAKPNPWIEPIDAGKFGPTCYNAMIPPELEIVAKPPLEDEDCLSINVWTPTKKRSKGPAAVLLWTYGGGFTFGGSFTPVYDGTNLVRDQQDVIVVSFNYRLAVFGYPGSRGLPAKQQNPGLLDVRSAVEWTRDNIAAFGGDPKRITLFGESAGGSTTDTYLYYAKDDPIIAGAIMQSGTVSLTDIGVLGLPFGESWGNLTRLVDCGNQSAAQELECMRQVPAKYLRDTMSANNLTFTPAQDNGTVFSNYLSLLESGSRAKVPLLVGSNDQELLAVNNTAEAAATGSFSTLQTFTCPAAQTARYHARIAPTWQYRYFGAFPMRFGNFTMPGVASHGAEIPQVFGTYDPDGASEEQRDSSAYIQGAWAAFAKDPKQGLRKYAPNWPTYSRACKSLVRLTYNNQPGATFVYPESYEAGCSF